MQVKDDSLHIESELLEVSSIQERLAMSFEERIEAHENAMEVHLYGHSCKVIAMDDLIQTKKSMTRPKDQETLRQLLQIKNLKKT